MRLRPPSVPPPPMPSLPLELPLELALPLLLLPLLLPLQPSSSRSCSSSRPSPQTMHALCSPTWHPSELHAQPILACGQHTLEEPKGNSEQGDLHIVGTRMASLWCRSQRRTPVMTGWLN